MLARADAGDADAQLALDVYVHRLRHYVGAYLAVLGGLDVLTFTAGVGENAPVAARRRRRDPRPARAVGRPGAQRGARPARRASSPPTGRRSPSSSSRPTRSSRSPARRRPCSTPGPDRTRPRRASAAASASVVPATSRTRATPSTEEDTHAQGDPGPRGSWSGSSPSAVGLFGLVTTPYDHVVPVPNRIISYGAVAMMGTLVLLVITFAHGTRAGDID